MWNDGLIGSLHHVRALHFGCGAVFVPPVRAVELESGLVCLLVGLFGSTRPVHALDGLRFLVVDVVQERRKDAPGFAEFV